MVRRLFALAAAAAVLAACSKTGSAGGSAGTPTGIIPGTLRIAIQSDLKNLNPLLANNTTDTMVARLMFEPLLSADPHGNPVPMLATQVPTTANGGISKDGLTVTYHLRPNADWSDGVPVTSNDVKWSWEAIVNKNNNVISTADFDVVKSIDTPNAKTVVVHLKHKFAPFINEFFAEGDASYDVAPAHVLAKYPNVNNVPFNSNPTVTDGPFTFVRWVRGDHLEFAANPKFFMGAPKLKRVLVEVVPDENTTINMLRTHAIDWMFESSINNYPSVKTIPGIKIYWDHLNGYEYLQINTQRPFLQDVRVRRALALALDKRELVNTLTFGQQQEAYEDQPSFMWSFDRGLKEYPFDVAQARALLQQAGWTMGSDGYMHKAGQRLTLVLVTDNSNATRRKAVVEIQAMLAKIGIRVEMKYFQGDVLFAPAGEGGVLSSGSFDIAYDGWIAGVDPDDSSQFLCAQAAPNGENYARYCSTEMDALQTQAIDHYNQATRKAAYDRIQQLTYRDVPYIYVYYETFMQPISTAFHGFAPNPVTEDWNAWQWSI